MQVSIGLLDREVLAVRAVLDPKQYRQAMFQATKRTTRRGRVMAGDVVREALPIRKKFIDDPKSSDAAIKATFDKSTQTGSIVTRDKPIPLAEFPNSETAKGITVKLDKKKPRLTLRHAFKESVSSKAQLAQAVAHVGIFSRRKNVTSRLGQTYDYRGKKYKIGKNAKGIMWRIPMEERTGPTPFQRVKKDDVLAPLLQNLGELFREEFGNQISRFTDGRIKSLPALLGETDQD